MADRQQTVTSVFSIITPTLMAIIGTMVLNSQSENRAMLAEIKADLKQVKEETIEGRTKIQSLGREVDKLNAKVFVYHPQAQPAKHEPLFVLNTPPEK